MDPNTPLPLPSNSLLADSLANRGMMRSLTPAPKLPANLPPALLAALDRDTQNADRATGINRDEAGQHDMLVGRFGSASIDPKTRKVSRDIIGPQSEDKVQTGAADVMNDVASGRFRGQYDPRTQTAFFSTTAPNSTRIHETEHGITDMAARDIAKGITNSSDRLPMVQQMAALARSGVYTPEGNVVSNRDNYSPARQALSMTLDELHSHMHERGLDPNDQMAGAAHFLFDSPTNAYRRQAYGDMIGNISPGVGLGFRAVGKIPAAGEALGNATQLGPALSGIGPAAKGIAGAVGDVAGGVRSAGSRLLDALGGNK